MRPTCDAEVTQDCVVTLEPVHALVERTIRRELHFDEPGARSKAWSSVDPDLEADDVREEIASLHYDLAAPLAGGACPGHRSLSPAPGRGV